MNEKQWLEESLINYFTSVINTIFNFSFFVVTHRDRPDFIIKEPYRNKIFGVEVTNLYYDEEDAKEILGRGNINHPKIETIEHYIYMLNKLLEKKSRKAEGYDQNHELILLIGITSQLFTREDFENSREDIIIPQNRYSIICLVFFNESNQNWEDLMFIKHESSIFNFDIHLVE